MEFLVQMVGMAVAVAAGLPFGAAVRWSPGEEDESKIGGSTNGKGKPRKGGPSFILASLTM